MHTFGPPVSLHSPVRREHPLNRCHLTREGLRLEISNQVESLVGPIPWRTYDQPV